MIFLKKIIDKMIWALDEWHDKKDEESHQDIRTKNSKLDSRLRNHRHDFSKMFTDKAIY